MTLVAYIAWILGPAFRWWWAVLTGVASIIGVMITPESGVMLSKVAIVIVVCLLSLLLFVAASTLVQGWRLFASRHRPLRVRKIDKSDDGGELSFVLDGFIPEGNGSLLEVRRIADGAERPFSIVKVIDTSADGCHHAISIWNAPIQLKAYSKRGFEARDLVVRRTIRFDMMMEALEGLERKPSV